MRPITPTENHLVRRKGNEREFVDLLETVSYVINGESDLNQETFSKVLTSRGVSASIKVLNSSTMFLTLEDGQGLCVLVPRTQNVTRRLIKEAPNLATKNLPGSF